MDMVDTGLDELTFGFYKTIGSIKSQLFSTQVAIDT